MITTLYRAKTTFLGADSASTFYFNSKDKAQKFIDKQLNGEVIPVTIESDYPLNYSDGCTLNDLTFGEFDVTVTECVEVKPVEPYEVI